MPFNTVPDAARMAEQGDDVTVRYRSRRSGNDLERTGEVVEIFEDDDIYAVSVQTEPGKLTIVTWYASGADPQVFSLTVVDNAVAIQLGAGVKSKQHLGALVAYEERGVPA